MWAIWLIGTVISSLLTFGSTAGQSTGSHLSVGTDKSPPGEQVFIALNLVPAPEDEFRAVRVEIRFPKNLLSFEEAKKGAALVAVGGELLTTQGENKQDSAQTTLSIQGKSDQPIAAGVLAYLTFKVSSQAPLGEKIALKTLADGSLQQDLADTKPLKVLDGSVEVVDQPRMFACFFYMH
ncbi:MAG: hypothetical protein HY644_09160 [Acidobacteria bacterium]|nr:hypothetical protein [Acidobacteriota bacterium]